MKILALEPYYGGSHQAFLDGWMTRSRHTWTLFTLPATKWKWRMRHASVKFSRDIRRAADGGADWDLLFCSEMLNLAEFQGLVPEAVRQLPAIVYFHENQITYPVQEIKDQDHHFSFSNMITALAADRVWFNSSFHRESFLIGLRNLLRRMPDHQPLEEVDRIREKSAIRPPGIDPFPPRGPRAKGPLRILWAARWEYDKSPQVFFEALNILVSRGVDFRVSVIGGGNERNVLPLFDEARRKLEDRILHWGYMDSREAYGAALAQADVAVSTAAHEFFGISLVEAVAAGAYPLVPDRLAYPEVLEAAGEEGKRLFFYSGKARDLADRLEGLANRLATDDLWLGNPQLGIRAVSRFAWDRLVPAWDDELESLAVARFTPRK